MWSRGRGEGSEKTRHTKQSNQAQVDQDRPVPVSRAGPHQEDNQHAAHHKIQFELHGRYGVPDVVRRQLRLLLVRAEHDGDGARDRDDDAPEVPLPEYLLEQDGRDHTVGDQRHDAQGADNRRGREPVGEEVAHLADGDQDLAQPPVRVLQVGGRDLFRRLAAAVRGPRVYGLERLR